MKTTALLAAHEKAGGRLVEFAGWQMPVHYTGIMDEHRTVREAAGLFDISHMGEVIFRGEGACAFLNSALTNDVAKLDVGQGQYTILTNEQGGVIDDLILYRLADNEYYAVVNASMKDTNLEWLRNLQEQSEAECEIVDISADIGALALQGPKAPAIMARFLQTENRDLPDHFHAKRFHWQDIDKLLLARTGYTGEDGLEIFFPVHQSERVWNALLENGREFGLKPAGLGARDTLRLEACFPLNGSDLAPDRTPLEAGLGFAVSLHKKAEFPGKDVMLEQKAAGVPRRLAALRVTGKGAPPRSHYPVVVGEEEIGELSSGCLSPTLGYGIALAYLPKQHVRPGTAVKISVRGRELDAEVVKKPFYKRS